MIHADAFRAALQELHDAVHEQFFGNDSGLPPRLIKATNEAGCLLSLAQPEPEGPPMFKPDEVHPFVVRHYTDDQRPSIKGNGFDGLEVGEDRQEAEEFIAWINARLCPSLSNCSASIAALPFLLATQAPNGAASAVASVHSVAATH